MVACCACTFSDSDESSLFSSLCNTLYRRTLTGVFRLRDTLAVTHCVVPLKWTTGAGPTVGKFAQVQSYPIESYQGSSVSKNYFMLCRIGCRRRDQAGNRGASRGSRRHGWLKRRLPSRRSRFCGLFPASAPNERLHRKPLQQHEHPVVDDYYSYCLYHRQ